MVPKPCMKRRLTVACLGIVSFLVIVSSFSIHHGQRALQPISATKKTIDEVTTLLSIQYSYSFQRHVVQNENTIVASYEFLDDARTAHPTATVVVPMQGPVAGAGLEEPTTAPDVQDSLIESICDALDNNSTAMILRASVPATRWAGLTPESIRCHYQQLDSLLQSKLQLPPGSASLVITNFPHVLLYNPRDVKERLDFLLAPLIATDSSVDDWPLLASRGYGAGWTVAQLRQALQSVPHVVLAMYLEDAAAMKPSIIFFLSVLRVSYPNIDQARLKLDQWLGGDVYTFAHLHQIGLEWPQLSTVLQAFPCLCFADTEPTWEMLGHVRSVLKDDALHYLQRRLQVGPSTVQAMIKTHTRLSTYSVEGKIQPTLNALQSKIGLSSSELRKVILRMPSLIGMSIDEGRGLKKRLDFFHDKVGMTQPELRTCVIKQPSLLQYSVDNSLRPKLDFFISELCVPWTEMPRMITRQPTLMGLSLEETLRPTATALMESCGLEPDDLGSIISRAPNVLTLSWKRNLEPTLEYLRKRLSLSKPQLKELIWTTPRVLTHSIKSSLEPKLQMVQAALEQEGSEQEATRVVAANPALLVTSNSVLRERLQSRLDSTGGPSVSELLQSRSRGVVRRNRRVIEMDADTNEVIREYPSAREAAKELRTSAPNVHNICKTRRLYKGKKYAFGSSPEVDATPFTFLTRPAPKKPRNEKRSRPLVFKDLRTSLRMGQSPDDPALRIIVHVSGRVFPPDNINQVRGLRKAGGIALYFPQIDQYQHGPELSMRLRRAAENSFGQIMPADEDGSYYNDGRILSGFPYLRPSRNRCELYACHHALKVVNQLLKHEAASLVSLKDDTVLVDLYTDSDYAWKLLHNVTRLQAWGKCPTAPVHDGPGPTSRVNPDLLHPLSRTYYRLLMQQDTDGQRLELGKQVIVNFHHAAGNLRSLHDYAKKAAIWMDQRAHADIDGS